MNLIELRQQRAKLVADMQALVNGATADLTDDEAKRFDTLKAEERRLADRIERAEYLADAERRAQGTPVAESHDFDRLVGKVSVLKVLQAQMEGRSLDGAEAEYAQEAERRSGRKAQGVFIPLQALESRNTTTTAPELVGETHRADQYIEALRNKLLARQLGVRVLTGLQGDVVIPKHGSGTSVGWVQENGTLSSSDMSFDNVTLSPKHAGGISEMSRQLIQQSSPDIEDLIREDLMFQIAAAIDKALIDGGGSNEPTGVLKAAGTQAQDLTALDWVSINAMLEKAEVANTQAANFLTNPGLATVLRTTLKEEGLPGYLLDGGRMADKPVSVSNHVPASKLILGDWSQVLLGVWSEVDLLVNPYEADAYSRGAVKIRAMSTVDIAIRHPQAFIIGTTA